MLYREGIRGANIKGRRAFMSEKNEETRYPLGFSFILFYSQVVELIFSTAMQLKFIIFDIDKLFFKN